MGNHIQADCESTDDNNTSIETKLTPIWEQIREKEMLSYQQQQLLEHTDIIKHI